MTDLTSLRKHPDLIPQEATNFESPLSLLDSFITPVDRFFVRSNGSSAATAIDPAEWRLAVTGCVANELVLTLDDLRAMPATTITAFLECSGNSRSRFTGIGPKAVSGTNWGDGAVGNAEWTGVPLAAVLAVTGPTPEAVDVVAQGGDFAEMRRALPLDVATNGDVLLAWAMNGEPLLPVHGAPVRLIVPGWGAIASTKWVVGLEVIDGPFDGYWNADNYVLYDETGTPTGPVTRMPVKSLITSPADGATIPAGAVTITGFAWSGSDPIRRVEVSADNGQTWSDAEITAQAGPHSWSQFRFEWNATPGQHTLQSRATDGAGNIQPELAIWNAKGYQMNSIRAVEVTSA